MNKNCALITLLIICMLLSSCKTSDKKVLNYQELESEQSKQANNSKQENSTTNENNDKKDVTDKQIKNKFDKYSCTINKDGDIYVLDNNGTKIFENNLSTNEYTWDSLVSEVISLEFNKNYDKVIVVTGVMARRLLYVVDIDKQKLVCYGSISDYRNNNVINYENDYVVFYTNPTSYDVYSHAQEINSKKYDELKLINLKTEEVITLDKSLNLLGSLEQIDTNTIKYANDYNRSNLLDLSCYFDQERVKVRDNIVHFIIENDTNAEYKDKTISLLETYYINNQYYQKIKVSTNQDSNVYELWCFKNEVYNKVLQGEQLDCYLFNDKLYASSTKLRNPNFVMVNGYDTELISCLLVKQFSISPNKKYFAISDPAGHFAVFDNYNNQIININLYDKVEDYLKSNLEIEHVIWDNNDENAIVMIKDTNTKILMDIKVVNIKNKSSHSINIPIKCKYDEFYYDVEKSFVLFASKNEYKSDGSVNETDNMHLYVYNIINEKILEIAQGDYDRCYFIYEQDMVKCYPTKIENEIVEVFC